MAWLAHQPLHRLFARPHGEPEDACRKRREADVFAGVYRWRAIIALLLVLTAVSGRVNADLDVANAKANIVDEQLRVLLDLDLDLGEPIEEALQNGIPVIIAIEMELNRARAWLPNVYISDWRNDFEVRYHSLSSHYIVSETGRGKLASFDTLDEALAAMGDNRLITVPLPTIPTNPEIQYALSIRARLDVEALPTPLRLLGYIMPDWRISSRWTTWPVDS